MELLKVVYFPGSDSGPVKDFLSDLRQRHLKAHVKLFLDLTVLEREGVASSKITIRSLGQGLWELKRLFAGIQYRIFFCVEDGRAWLLHAIEKKSAKAPLDDLRLARRRMRGVVT